MIMLCSNAQVCNHQIGKGADESGGVIERGHQLKLLDAEMPGQLARFDVDLGERFDVVGDERDRHDEDTLRAERGEPSQSFGERRLEPLTRVDAALVAGPGMG